MVELEHPVEIEDVAEHDPTYRRVVAVIVVLITLFGSVVAYAHAVESNKEDRAARDAQRDAIAGLGAQVDSTAALSTDLQIGSQVDAQVQRAAINAGRVDNFAENPDVDSSLALERHLAVRDVVAALTPVDSADQASINAEFAEGNESPDAARLRQAVEADAANDHGGKADNYVAVLTVLAVALFLVGLSLTVQGRSRFVLAAPGIAIALVCVGWAGLVASQDVTSVSGTAIRKTAEGQRLADAGEFDAALVAFDQAIADSPDFAAAFARRAATRFRAGSRQLGQIGFVSVAEPEVIDDVVEDMDHALSLGGSSDLATVADAGFLHFLAKDFGRSAELSRQALAINDQLASVWFNLGVAEVARGRRPAAEDAYREARLLLEATADATARDTLLAAARTDLSIVRDFVEDGDVDEEVLALVQDLEESLAEFQAKSTDPPCDLDACPAADDVETAEVADASFVRDGPFVFADYRVDGAEPGTPITNVWYVRVDPDDPFQQPTFGVETARVDADGFVSTSVLPSNDPACPVGGEYLVRVYAGDLFLGEASGTIEPSPFGSAFKSVSDPIVGYRACVPEDFEVAQADVADIDSFTTFTGPALIYGVDVTPGALAAGEDPDVLEVTLLTTILELDESQLTEIRLNGRDLNEGFVALDGVAGVNVLDGVAVMMAASIGPDGVARTVTVTGSDDLTLLEEAVALVDFTGLPVQRPR